MNKIQHFTKIILLIFLLTLLTGQSSHAQVDDRYFGLTGHWVRGEFRDFYDAADNPRIVYGVAITDQFWSESEMIWVQYFNHARFELHIDVASEDRVVLTPIGTRLYTSHQSYPNSLPTQRCQQNDSWPQPVCFEFLDFFIEQGGEAQFGQPISGIEYFRGRWVQHFENVRLDYYPENSPGERVVVAELGRVYFDTVQEDHHLLEPSNRDYVYMQSIPNLRVWAFTDFAVVSEGDTQTVTVSVRDHNNMPLENAMVAILLEYPSNHGTDENHVGISLPPTNDYGITQASFVVDQDFIGQVNVKITVLFNTLSEIIYTSFRLWY